MSHKITVFRSGVFTDVFEAAASIYSLQKDGSKTNVMLEVEGVKGHLDIWYGDDVPVYSEIEIQNHLFNNIKYMRN